MRKVIPMIDNEFMDMWRFFKMVAIKTGGVTVGKENVLAIDDFINRQKETIEQLQTALFKCGEDAAEKQETINRQKAEIERLHKDCDELYEQMSERLKAELKIERRLSRAEAVKEFADSLKQARKKIYPLYTIDLFAEVIDNLVKEFTEGGDADRAD